MLPNTGGMAALAAAALPDFDLTQNGERTMPTREFQKTEVVRFLVQKHYLSSMVQPLSIPFSTFEQGCINGYLVYLYHASEHEYEEGFGPSVVVRIGEEDTTWKRSRNKWNSFEKIKTVEDASNPDDYKLVWDRTHMHSFYVTERMYYYLDREKHKGKFKHLRAKLYITRVQRRTEQTFLMQFILETVVEDESINASSMMIDSANSNTGHSSSPGGMLRVSPKVPRIGRLSSLKNSNDSNHSGEVSPTSGNSSPNFTTNSGNATPTTRYANSQANSVGSSSGLYTSNNVNNLNNSNFGQNTNSLGGYFNNNQQNLYATSGVNNFYAPFTPVASISPNLPPSLIAHFASPNAHFDPQQRIQSYPPMFAPPRLVPIVPTLAPQSSSTNLHSNQSNHDETSSPSTGATIHPMIGAYAAHPTLWTRPVPPSFPPPQQQQLSNNSSKSGTNSPSSSNGMNPDDQASTNSNSPSLHLAHLTAPQLQALSDQQLQHQIAQIQREQAIFQQLYAAQLPHLIPLFASPDYQFPTTQQPYAQPIKTRSLDPNLLSGSQWKGDGKRNLDSTSSDFQENASKRRSLENSSNDFAGGINSPSSSSSSPRSSNTSGFPQNPPKPSSPRKHVSTFPSQSSSFSPRVSSVSNNTMHSKPSPSSSGSQSAAVSLQQLKFSTPSSHK